MADESLPLFFKAVLKVCATKHTWQMFKAAKICGGRLDVPYSGHK